MGLMTIAELIELLRKNFTRLLAFSLAVGLFALIAAEKMQTYTCTLNYKYNYSEAAEGFAPDGSSKLNPYEIQEPLVIRSALTDIGLGDSKEVNVEKIRNNIVISEIVEELDQEVSESAALLGERYDVQPTEFKIKYTYSASMGGEFGARFFDSLITQYDIFLLKNYYNKKEVADFVKVLNPEAEDYLPMADAMSSNIDSIVEYLESLASYYPDFRSKRNGYSFTDLAYLYHNLRDIQYAKYYGNIRSGNLSKDPETVIKNYTARLEELTVDWEVADSIANSYSEEIVSFYDAYKKTGLYTQASKMQTAMDSTNNKDEDVLEHYDINKLTNTYDGIVLKYTSNAGEASRLARDIDHCRTVIDSFSNDTVEPAVKASLLRKNEQLYSELAALSEEYAALANEAVDELYDLKVNEDLQYLIVTDIQEDKPVSVIVVFAMVLSFGLLYIFFVIKQLLGKAAPPEAEEELVSEMSELQRLFYAQYKQGFKECYLVYQPMLSCETGEETNFEAFIRWNSEEYGAVSAVKTIECASELGLLPQFNDWIIDKICENLAKRAENGEYVPVIHVNCPYFSVQDFAIADVIVKRAAEHGVEIGNICMEIDSPNVMSCMEDILLLQKLGVKICIDRFESSTEQEEIFKALVPEYIKLSVDVVNNDLLATSEEEINAANTESLRFIFKTLISCERSGIKACICGIETKEQEKMFVSSMPFDYKQGYLYGKPLPYR